jgi:nitrite reductase [NAD(P)H] large subunit
MSANARDEVVLYSEPKRGIYKKLVIRDDRLIGAILLGDTGKAAYLLQAFDYSMRSVSVATSELA